MDGTNWLTSLVCGALAVLGALWLSLVSRRVSSLEGRVNQMQRDHESHRVEMEERVRLSRLEFGAEVREIVKPLRDRMDRIDDNLAQLNTMVSSILNNGVAGGEPNSTGASEAGVREDREGH